MIQLHYYPGNASMTPHMLVTDGAPVLSSPKFNTQEPFVAG